MKVTCPLEYMVSWGIKKSNPPGDIQILIFQNIIPFWTNRVKCYTNCIDYEVDL